MSVSSLKIKLLNILTVIYIFCWNYFILIYFTETILLEKTPAFAIDYLFTQISNLYQNNCDDVSENNFPM